MQAFAFRWIAVLAVVTAFFTASSIRAETIPPPPAQYFNDYAGVVSRATADSLNRELEQFERDTSNQLIAAVFPRMDSESSIEDYTVRVAQSWRVGQKARNNGAVLFVFIQEHQLYIQVGYGLEPVLTDATCFQIIENNIKPYFKAGDFSSGLRAGIHAMMAASRGEYRGTGGNHAQTRGSRSSGLHVFPIIFFIIVMIVSGLFRGRRRGWRSHDDDGFGPRGGFGGFGGFGGGGSSSGSGGGFSGGGGSFGGGGAGGRW
jgi:uncharacterized protein